MQEPLFPLVIAMGNVMDSTIMYINDLPRHLLDINPVKFIPLQLRLVRGPESETLPLLWDFCRHVSFQSFTQGYLKNACLHLIGWWVSLCSNILFLSKESQVTHTKRWVNLFWNTITDKNNTQSYLR